MHTVDVSALTKTYPAASGMSDAATEAWLSLAVIALFAAVLMAVAIRAFTRSAVD